MSNESPAVTFAIGDPGRAAREILRGAPPAWAGPPDTELSSFALAGMVVQAASCRGLMHRFRGTHRQDAFALAALAAKSELPGGDGAERVIAVVCDGVGQFGRSDEAAATASQWLAALGSQPVPWPDAFTIVNEELAKLAADARASAPDCDGNPDAAGMATTAMAVAVRRDAENWAGEAAWAGDSTLWHLSPDGDWTLIAGPAGDDDDDDYHTTSVRPLPNPDGACEARGFQTGPGALFVMTDGVANPLRWSDAVQVTLAEWWRRPPDPFTFGAQVGFARKTHMDDRTVIGLWPDTGEKDAGRQG